MALMNQRKDFLVSFGVWQHLEAMSLMTSDSGVSLYTKSLSRPDFNRQVD
jgi:hypothetical protein